MKTRNITGQFQTANLPMDEIIRLYQQGAFQEEIAKQFGVSQGTIWKRLTEAGITRSSGDSRRLRWARMTPEQRFAQLEAAHIASTRKRSHWEKTQKALANQVNPILSDLELKFLELFQTQKIPVIPQYALDIYNIDFAIPESQIAIEIDGGNWHTETRKATSDRGKEVLLRNRNWTLIRIQVKAFEGRLNILSDLNGKDISHIMKAIYSNPSIFC